MASNSQGIQQLLAAEKAAAEKVAAARKRRLHTHSHKQKFVYLNVCMASAHSYQAWKCAYLFRV